VAEGYQASVALILVFLHSGPLQDGDLPCQLPCLQRFLCFSISKGGLHQLFTCLNHLFNLAEQDAVGLLKISDIPRQFIPAMTPILRPAVNPFTRCGYAFKPAVAPDVLWRCYFFVSSELTSPCTCGATFAENRLRTHHLVSGERSMPSHSFPIILASSSMPLFSHSAPVAQYITRITAFVAFQ